MNTEGTTITQFRRHEEARPDLFKRQSDTIAPFIENEAEVSEAAGPVAVRKKMLSGFTSRWTRFAAWAIPNASQTCANQVGARFLREVKECHITKEIARPIPSPNPSMVGLQ
jgi:hypothetical protein